MAKLLLIQLSSYFVFGKVEIVDYYLWSWIRLTTLAEMVLMIVFWGSRQAAKAMLLVKLCSRPNPS